MQNTRLSTLIDRISQQFIQWAENPWRRSSLIIISLLFGNFLATAIASSTGQRTDLDILVSLIILVVTELISWLTYGTALGRRQAGKYNSILGQRPIWIAILNSLKIGVVYGLFVEGFKLGS
jgi:Na+-transporting NADH:ubiquinone oxidoreductase subunit NqrB